MKRFIDFLIEQQNEESAARYALDLLWKRGRATATKSIRAASGRQLANVIQQASQKYNTILTEKDLMAEFESIDPYHISFSRSDYDTIIIVNHKLLDT